MLNWELVLDEHICCCFIANVDAIFVVVAEHDEFCYCCCFGNFPSCVAILILLLPDLVGYFNFQSQYKTTKLSPEVASILAAVLRYTRLRGPHHPSLANHK